MPKVATAVPLKPGGEVGVGKGWRNQKGTRTGIAGAGKLFGNRLTVRQMKAIMDAGLPLPPDEKPVPVCPEEPREWVGLPDTVRGMKWVMTFSDTWDDDARKGYRKIWKEDPKGFVQLLAKLESDHQERLAAKEARREGGVKVVHGDEHLMELLDGWHSVEVGS